MAKAKTSPEPEQEVVTVTQDEMAVAAAPEPVKPKGFDSVRYANVLQGQPVCWFQDADHSREPFTAFPEKNNGQGILTMRVFINNTQLVKTGVRHIHDPELANTTNDAKRHSGGWCLPLEFVAITQRIREEKWLRAEEEREAQMAARELERQRSIREKAEFESHLAALAKS
jgi:hypothetical protein